MHKSPSAMMVGGSRGKQASEKPVKPGCTNIVEFGGINDWMGETFSGIS